MTRPATVTKKFLKARTEKNLERQMLINNIKYNVSFDYEDIQKIGSVWYAWYYVDIKTTLTLEMIRKVNR